VTALLLRRGHRLCLDHLLCRRAGPATHGLADLPGVWCGMVHIESSGEKNECGMVDLDETWSHPFINLSLLDCVLVAVEVQVSESSRQFLIWLLQRGSGPLQLGHCGVHGPIALVLLGL